MADSKIKESFSVKYGIHSEFDDGRYRWWQTNWGFDQFDVIDKAELDQRIEAAKRNDITVTDDLFGDNE